MRCEVNIQAIEGTDQDLLKSLVEAAEYSCVNLRTLMAGSWFRPGHKGVDRIESHVRAGR
jgi:hypothetical protein